MISPEKHPKSEKVILRFPDASSELDPKTLLSTESNSILPNLRNTFVKVALPVKLSARPSNLPRQIEFINHSRSFTPIFKVPWQSTLLGDITTPASSRVVVHDMYGSITSSRRIRPYTPSRSLLPGSKSSLNAKFGSSDLIVEESLLRPLSTSSWQNKVSLGKLQHLVHRNKTVSPNK